MVRVDTGGQHLRGGLEEGAGIQGPREHASTPASGTRCDSGHIFLHQRRRFGVKSRSDSPVSPRSEVGVTHNVLAPRSFRWRLLAWKIGPLSSLLLVVTSPLPPLPPSGSMKVAERGFSPATASAVWRCSAYWPTFSRTLSLISPARVGERACAPRGMRMRVSL